jgi:hypothetical protein
VEGTSDAEFDWGDESSLHRVGRGLKVALAFVVVAVVVAAFAAVWSMIFGVMSGSMWLGLFGALIVLLAIGGVIELVIQGHRRERAELARRRPLGSDDARLR